MRKIQSSQLSNYKTYTMYLRQLTTLAENVFEFKNLPSNIDVSYLNKNLLNKGSVAFFYDEILEEVLALPFVTIGNLDVYGRPQTIQVMGMNGYIKKLKKGEFVIMYDNNGRYPLTIDITQYAERMAQATRVIDINLSQQKTPRIFKTSANKEKTLHDLLNRVESTENTILAYDDIDLDDTNIVLAPAPFVADKVEEQKREIWNEFLRLIGISNLSYQKKERNISDEIQAMQGGTVASRFSRFEPRKRAIEEINEKFGMYLKEKIEVQYYDGEPSTIEEEEVEKYDELLDDESLSNT